MFATLKAIGHEIGETVKVFGGIGFDKLANDLDERKRALRDRAYYGE